MIRSRQAGFTLIELLVVIAILSILAALGSGTYFRIRAAQQVTSTESTLQQVSTGLDRIWSATRDQAEKEFNSGNLPGGNNIQTLINYCGGAGEKERARALWMYLRMKNEFPNTFSEAWTEIKLVDPINTSITVIKLAPKKTFTSKLPPAASCGTTSQANANNQAAALLYLILTEKGTRGETFNTDTVSARSGTLENVNGRRFTVFNDAWGSPLSFARFYWATELQEPPYSRSVTTALPSKDPFDIYDKLGAARWTGTRADSARTVIGIQSPFRVQNGSSNNWIPTIISAGANREWDLFDVRYTRQGMPMSDSNIGLVDKIIDSSAPDRDNIVSYRLRQFGARGD